MKNTIDILFLLFESIPMWFWFEHIWQPQCPNQAEFPPVRVSFPANHCRSVRVSRQKCPWPVSSAKRGTHSGVSHIRYVWLTSDCPCVALCPGSCVFVSQHRAGAHYCWRALHLSPSTPTLLPPSSYSWSLTSTTIDLPQHTHMCVEIEQPRRSSSLQKLRKEPPFTVWVSSSEWNIGWEVEKVKITKMQKYATKMSSSQRRLGCEGGVQTFPN